MTPEDLTSKAADPTAVKDFWLESVRPLHERGQLDKIKPIPATTPRLKDVARVQNAALTRKVIAGFGPNYDKIQWGKHA